MGCGLSDTGLGKILSNSGNCHEASQTVSFGNFAKIYSANSALFVFVYAVICVYDSLVCFVFCLYLYVSRYFGDFGVIMGCMLRSCE